MGDIPAAMKAMVLYGINDIRMVYDKPVPSPGPGEVLVKVAACGLCGTDVKIITKGEAAMPGLPPFGSFTPGHEWTGTVAALGEGVTEFSIGDRVAVQAHKGCGQCSNCMEGNYTSCLNYGKLEKGHRTTGMTADGGFAEYAIHHINAVYKLPDNVDLAEAAYVTTLGCALWAVDTSGGYIAGDSCLIMGPGPIGLSVVQAVKALGAEKIVLVGTREERLKIGREIGATHTVNINETEDVLGELMKITGGRGFERTFDCAGTENAFDVCMKATMKGKKMTLVAFYKDAIKADLNAAIRSGVQIHTVRGEGGNNCRRALSLMSQGKASSKPIMTHTFPLEEFDKAYDYFVNRRDGAMKVTLIP
ncbi:zinc-binding dehydrogenase [Lachnospiraceae bacterium 62-35]